MEHHVDLVTAVMISLSNMMEVLDYKESLKISFLETNIFKKLAEVMDLK